MLADLIQNTLDGLTAGVKGGPSKYCTSCYTGSYPVAFPRDEEAYLQLALKLGPDSPPAANQPEPIIPFLEKDPVIG